MRPTPYLVSVRRLAAVLALACLAPAAAAAQSPMLCSKPIQPLCSTDVQAFADESERQRCLSDTDGYLDELRGYHECLTQAARDAEQVLEQTEGFKRCLQEGRDDCGLDGDNSI